MLGGRGSGQQTKLIFLIVLVGNISIGHKQQGEKGNDGYRSSEEISLIYIRGGTEILGES